MSAQHQSKKKNSQPGRKEDQWYESNKGAVGYASFVLFFSFGLRSGL